ncbi:MAG: hypothetical protein GX547_15900 [Phycisphaerae bacterium]|nr:hypothetical protein [Phycisphaerae bacterium]
MSTKCLSIGLVLALASGALADLSDISEVIFRIEASNASGTGVLEFTQDQLVYNANTDTYIWNTGTQFIFDEFFTPIATLQNANLALQLNSTKKIAGAFAVQSGSTDTVFTITMPQLSFANLAAPSASVGLAVNVTDTNNNGVAMLAVPPAGGILITHYNGLVPSGTLFEEVLPGVSNPTGSTSTLAYVPYTPLPFGAGDMNSQLAFSLTAGDLGGGTHYFQIIPEPAGLALLASGLLLLGRRR